MQPQENKVRALIHSSCLTLDQGEYAQYMKLFANPMRYRVVTYSPELRKEMTWLDHDTDEMKHLFKMLPQHVTLPGTFFRHAVVCETHQVEDGWRAVTSLMLTYTDLDGGSRLMAVGRYHDVIKEHDGDLLITEREVRLETRDLGPGLQVPL